MWENLGVGWGLERVINAPDSPLGCGLWVILDRSQYSVIRLRLGGGRGKKVGVRNECMDYVAGLAAKAKMVSCSELYGYQARLRMRGNVICQYV